MLSFPVLLIPVFLPYFGKPVYVGFRHLPEHEPHPQDHIPDLDQVVQRIDTPSTAVPVPVPFPGHIYQTVMFLMPEIRSIPFQHTGFMELQVSKQISFPRCLNLFFGYAGHCTGTVILFIVLCLLPVME